MMWRERGSLNQSQSRSRTKRRVLENRRRDGGLAPASAAARTAEHDLIPTRDGGALLLGGLVHQFFGVGLLRRLLDELLGLVGPVLDARRWIRSARFIGAPKVVMVDHRWMKRIGRSDGASDRMLIRPLGQSGADLFSSQIRPGRFTFAGSDRGHGLEVVGVIGLVEQARFYRIVHNDGRLPAEIGCVRNRSRIGGADCMGG